MSTTKYLLLSTFSILLSPLFTSTTFAADAADKFSLKYWKLELPLDENDDGEDKGFWYPACSGTGDWETDKENGDYASVAFAKIQLSRAVDRRQ